MTWFTPFFLLLSKIIRLCHSSLETAPCHCSCDQHTSRWMPSHLPFIVIQSNTARKYNFFSHQDHFFLTTTCLAVKRRKKCFLATELAHTNGCSFKHKLVIFAKLSSMQHFFSSIYDRIVYKKLSLLFFAFIFFVYILSKYFFLFNVCMTRCVKEHRHIVDWNNETPQTNVWNKLHVNTPVLFRHRHRYTCSPGHLHRLPMILAWKEHVAYSKFTQEINTNLIAHSNWTYAAIKWNLVNYSYFSIEDTSVSEL